MMFGLQDSVDKRQNSLFFLSKMRTGGDRRFTQRMLEVIAGLLHCILPQSVNVLRILHARVPIVKFSHVATGIDCDICLENEYVLLTLGIRRSIACLATFCSCQLLKNGLRHLYKPAQLLQCLCQLINL